MRALEGIPCPPVGDLEQDRRLLLEKMNWPEERLEDYLRRPGRPHDDYPTERLFGQFCVGVYERFFKR